MLHPPTASSALRRRSDATGTSLRYVSSHGSRDSASASAASAPGTIASSASRGKMYGAVVTSTPVIRAADRPPFARRVTRVPSSASRASVASVAGSSEPSSTTTSSCSSSLSSDAMVAGSVSPSLKQGTTTATRGIRRRVTTSERDVEKGRDPQPVEAGIVRVDHERRLGAPNEAGERAGPCEAAVSSGSRPRLEAKRRRPALACKPPGGVEQSKSRPEPAATWAPRDDLPRRCAGVRDSDERAAAVRAEQLDDLECSAAHEPVPCIRAGDGPRVAVDARRRQLRVRGGGLVQSKAVLAGEDARPARGDSLGRCEQADR